MKILYQASGYCASDYIPASDEHFMVTYDGVSDIDIKIIIPQKSGTVELSPGASHSKYGLLTTTIVVSL